MFRPAIGLILCVTFLVTACAPARESRLNPFNWFGGSQEERIEPVEADANPLIPQGVGIALRLRKKVDPLEATSPITTITDLRMERVPGGAILRVTGMDPQAGAYNVILAPENEDEIAVDGVLSYTMRRELAARPTPTTSQRARQVTVARRLTDQQLAGVRTIRVKGVENARVVRR